MNPMSFIKHLLGNEVKGARNIYNQLNPLDGGRTLSQPLSQNDRLAQLLRGAMVAGAPGGDQEVIPQRGRQASQMPMMQQNIAPPEVGGPGGYQNFSDGVGVMPQQGSYNGNLYEDGSSGVPPQQLQQTGGWDLQGVVPGDRAQYGDSGQLNSQHPLIQKLMHYYRNLI